MLAVDCSNYTGPLTADALAAWKATGIGLVICQAIDPPPRYPTGETRAQIQACVDAGLAVDAYCWLWFDLDETDIQQKLALLGGLQIRQLWLDVEDTAAQKYDQATTEQKITAALALLDAHPTTSNEKAGIYTGRWYWTDRRYLGNSTAFADRELWDAAYDGQQTTDGFAAYGGWPSRAIHQYAGTSTLAGIGNVDLDVLSVSEASELVARETPADWPAEWPTWREAAINYRGIADALGNQVSGAQAQLQQATQERDAAQGQTGTLSGLLEQKLQAITDLQARITAAGKALGLVQGTP